ncbi:CaiB/BaiF CoA transferase family protein, partial [Thermodesulfobacteriota bacterium]
MDSPITESDSSNFALKPYRILDLTEGGSMIGGRILGDLGADVIKIEPPEGSPSRIAPYYKNTHDAEKSLYWYAYNMNKRGITLNLSSITGKKIFKKLAATADVIMESFPPGYLDGLELGYKNLVERRPDIIVTSITPYGQTGPKAHFRGSDLTASASGGSLFIAGDPDRAPTWIGFPQACLFGGAEAAIGTLTALWHRRTTGEGQQVDVSLQECAMSPTQNVLPTWAVNRINFQRQGNALYSPAAGIKIPTYFECRDGTVFFFLQGGNEPFISSTQRLVEWMDEEGMCDKWLREIDLIRDFDARTMKQKTVDQVAAAISGFMSTKTKTELYREGGIRRRILIAPLYTTKDIWDDIQLRSRNYWVQTGHSELGKSLSYCGPFIKMSATPIKYRLRAPLLGEHNEEIFSENSAPRLPNEVKDLPPRKPVKTFEGLKIAEFAWQLVGPLTSRYFADHGATVVRVESHNRPDTLRMVTPFAGDRVSVDSSMFYGRGGANKYGISIDLNHPNGQKLARKLIQLADIMSESFSPGVMERWGLDYDSVTKFRPDIIYLSTSMQGRSGPHTAYAGFGQSACALSGFSEVSGWPDRMPAPPYGAYTDYLCPRFNAAALIAALEYRQRTGKGQFLEQSQLESALHFFAPPIMDYQINGRIAGRNGNRIQSAAPHGLFPCEG